MTKFAAHIARVSGGHPKVLKHTILLVERARQLTQNGNSEVETEYGAQLVMQGAHSDAAIAFKAAASLDDSNVAAQMGLVECLLGLNSVKDAWNRKELLVDLVASMGGEPVKLTFLSAVLARIKEKRISEGLKRLDMCRKAHLAAYDTALAATGPSIDALVSLDPQFVLQVVEEYMLHVSAEPISAGSAVPPALSAMVNLTDMLTRVLPGCTQGLFCLARAQYLQANFDAALHTLNMLFDRQDSHAQGQLLRAQIYLATGDTQAAEQAVASALADDMKVQKTTLYFLLKAKVLEGKGLAEDQLALLEEALQLQGMNKVAKAGGSAADTFARANIYSMLIGSYMSYDRHTEAHAAIKEGVTLFAGTAEEGTISLAYADFVRKSGDTNRSLNMLKAIPSDSPHYFKAKMTQADIYLTARHDRKMYVSCFKQLVGSLPTGRNYILCGEAYLNVQEPENAIENFHLAERSDGESEYLAGRIGAAYVTAHRFRDAAQYYEQCLRKNGG